MSNNSYQLRKPSKSVALTNKNNALTKYQRQRLQEEGNRQFASLEKFYKDHEKTLIELLSQQNPNAKDVNDIITNIALTLPEENVHEYRELFANISKIDIRSILMLLLIICQINAVNGGNLPKFNIDASLVNNNKKYGQTLRKVCEAVSEMPIDALKKVNNVNLINCDLSDKYLDILAFFQPSTNELGVCIDRCKTLTPEDTKDVINHELMHASIHSNKELPSTDLRRVVPCDVDKNYNKCVDLLSKLPKELTKPRITRSIINQLSELDNQGFKEKSSSVSLKSHQRGLPSLEAILNAEGLQYTISKHDRENSMVHVAIPLAKYRSKIETLHDFAIQNTCREINNYQSKGNNMVAAEIIPQFTEQYSFDAIKIIFTTVFGQKNYNALFKAEIDRLQPVFENPKTTKSKKVHNECLVSLDTNQKKHEL